MNSTRKYSVIVPVYNSEKTLGELCERISATFNKLNASYQIILVNDCSTDNSWPAITDLKNNYGENLLAICLSINSGQHKALLCGFQFAKGDFVVTIDDDLQFFPEDIELLINKENETSADLIYGYYLNGKRHSLLRRAGSKFVALAFQKFGNTRGHGSSFKLIKKETVDKVKGYTHLHLYLDEILSWHTKKVAYAQVRHAPRREGKSGYGFFNLVLMTLNLIFTYTTIPLKIMTWFGFMSFWICLVFSGYFLYLKFSQGAQLGFTAVIVTVLMATGLILFSLGIIGEYLNRLLNMQHQKPGYLIREVLA